MRLYESGEFSTGTFGEFSTGIDSARMTVVADSHQRLVAAPIPLTLPGHDRTYLRINATTALRPSFDKPADGRARRVSSAMSGWSPEAAVSGLI